MILEVFDDIWDEFEDQEKQDLVHLVVKRITVNEPEGNLDLEFQDLAASFEPLAVEPGAKLPTTKDRTTRARRPWRPRALTCAPPTMEASPWPARGDERLPAPIAAHAVRVKRRRRRPARVAGRLALAHRSAANIEAGRYQDYADVARRHGITRVRLTQLMKNLLLPAPDIQEEVLALGFPAGREPVTERMLRWCSPACAGRTSTGVGRTAAGRGVICGQRLTDDPIAGDSWPALVTEGHSAAGRGT